MVNIRLKNVSKSFAETTVIDDISLDIEPGEFIVFLGPSGCGKSTLLRMIAGLESVGKGEIWIGDRRVDNLPAGERDIAMVFQHYALYPHMTVRENMAFGLRNVGVEKNEIDRRLADASKMLEIEALMERKPAAISGGQKQRVAIGRAIVKEPKLFLFDEPLSNLDAALRVRTRIEIAQLHRRVETAMIFVTHDQIEAMTLANRIVVINNHGIEQVGTPLEIYTRPATEFVAGFVGTPAMNLIPATLATPEDGFASVQLPDGSTVQSKIKTIELKPGDSCKFGIRAESIKVCPPASGDCNGRVNFVERLGDRTLVYVEIADNHTVIAEDIGLSKVQVDENIGIQFQAGSIHLFTKHAAYHADETA